MEKTTKHSKKKQLGYILIHNDRCKGCDLCIPVCPVNIIVQGESQSVNHLGWIPIKVDNMRQCTACKLCSIACPDQAIDVFKFDKPLFYK